MRFGLVASLRGGAGTRKIEVGDEIERVLS